MKRQEIYLDEYLENSRKLQDWEHYPKPEFAPADAETFGPRILWTAVGLFCGMVAPHLIVAVLAELADYLF